MIAFRQRTLLEELLRLWPPYRRRRDAETYAAIKWLVEHPEAPCEVFGTVVPNGYGDVEHSPPT